MADSNPITVDPRDITWTGPHGAPFESYWTVIFERSKGDHSAYYLTTIILLTLGILWLVRERGRHARVAGG
jgi:hypothetical protein